MATGLSISLSATSTLGPITALRLTPTCTMALLYVSVCVCLPTEPLAGSLDQLESQTPHPNPAPPCMSDTGAMMAHQPPKDSTATQKICLLGDEGSGSVASEKFLFRKASFNPILALMSRYQASKSFLLLCDETE